LVANGSTGRVILLVSDGKETCQGDPAVAAKSLAAKGITDDADKKCDERELELLRIDLDLHSSARLEAPYRYRALRFGSA
jgi:hypothetical protein